MLYRDASATLDVVPRHVAALVRAGHLRAGKPVASRDSLGRRCFRPTVTGASVRAYRRRQEAREAARWR